MLSEILSRLIETVAEQGEDMQVSVPFTTIKTISEVYEFNHPKFKLLFFRFNYHFINFNYILGTIYIINIDY